MVKVRDKSQIEEDKSRKTRERKEVEDEVKTRGINLFRFVLFYLTQRSFPPYIFSSDNPFASTKRASFLLYLSLLVPSYLCVPRKTYWNKMSTPLAPGLSLLLDPDGTSSPLSKQDTRRSFFFLLVTHAKYFSV